MKASTAPKGGSGDGDDGCRQDEPVDLIGSNYPEPEADSFATIHTPFRFLDLPAELRNTIYKYVIPRGTVQTYVWTQLDGSSDTSIFDRSAPPDALSVSRQVREECLPIYFSHSAFVFRKNFNVARKSFLSGETALASDSGLNKITRTVYLPAEVQAWATHYTKTHAEYITSATLSETTKLIHTTIEEDFIVSLYEEEMVNMQIFLRIAESGEIQGNAIGRSWEASKKLRFHRRLRGQAIIMAISESVSDPTWGRHGLRQVIAGQDAV